MNIVQSIQMDQAVNEGEDEVVIRLKNGRVIQLSPDFNAINVWEPGAWDEEERAYGFPNKVNSLFVILR